jgi:hypothetical protein
MLSVSSVVNPTPRDAAGYEVGNKAEEGLVPASADGIILTFLQ